MEKDWGKVILDEWVKILKTRDYELGEALAGCPSPMEIMVYIKRKKGRNVERITGLRACLYSDDVKPFKEYLQNQAKID